MNNEEKQKNLVSNYCWTGAGMSSTAGRLFAGWLSDRPWLHTITIGTPRPRQIIFFHFNFLNILSFGLFNF